MHPTTPRPKKQAKEHVAPNWPATLDEAATLANQTAMPLIHNGRPFETIGQTLARMTGEVPDPLPDEFVDRLAVSATDPDQAAKIGWIVDHCLTAKRKRGANV